MFTAITLHHPAAQHVDELVHFMRDVLAGLDGAEGLLDAHVARDPDGTHLAGVTSWRSRLDFERALPAIRALGPSRDPAWTVAADVAIRLESI